MEERRLGIPCLYGIPFQYGQILSLHISLFYRHPFKSAGVRNLDRRLSRLRPDVHNLEVWYPSGISFLYAVDIDLEGMPCC